MIELSDGTASLPAGPAAGVVLPIPRATVRPAFCTCAFISFPPLSSGKGSFLHVLRDIPCSLQPGGEKGEGRLARLGRSLCCARSCPPAPTASPGSGDERAAAVGGAGTLLQGAGAQRFTPLALHPRRPSPGASRWALSLSAPGPIFLPADSRCRTGGNPPVPGKGRAGRGAFGLLGDREAFPASAPVAADGRLRALDRPPSPAAVGEFS